MFNGWNGKLNVPKQAGRLSYLYTRLWQTTEFFKTINILNFDLDAESLYSNLRQSSKSLVKKRIDKDLRIASIALTQNATVVTRNYKDFSLVPNLKIENWSE